MDHATHLGLDVHKDTIVVAVLCPGEAEPGERTIANTPEALRALIRRGGFEHPVVCYEAGPTGYETHRLLTSLDVPSTWSLPRWSPVGLVLEWRSIGSMPATWLAFTEQGELTPIRVPSPTEEAIRDLVRVREDTKDDRPRPSTE